MRVRLATESATKGIDCIDRSWQCAATVTRYCCGINTHGFSNRSKRNVRKGRTRRRTLRPPCCNDGSRTGAHRTRRNRSSREGARSGSTRQARLDMLSARWPHRSLLRRRVLAAPANRDEDLAEGVGFEPTVPLPVLRFSRPAQSTALAPLRAGAPPTRHAEHAQRPRVRPAEPAPRPLASRASRLRRPLTDSRTARPSRSRSRAGQPPTRRNDAPFRHG